MRKVRALAAAIAVTATVGVSACASSGGGSASGSGSNVLTVVSWKGEGTNVGNMPTINAAFEKAYPNIKLEYKYVDSADYDTYNNPRLAAGTAADVIMVDRVHMNEYASEGFLMNLSDQPWVKRMDANLTGFNQVNGKTYQFNAENIPIGLFVNNTLLKQAGITSVPTTWPAFLTDLQTLKSKGIGGLELPDKGAWLGEQLALVLEASSVPTTWPAQYDAGKETFAPQWNTALGQIKQLFTAGLVNPTQALGMDPNTDGIPDFEAGKYAFMIQGAWALTAVLASTKDDITLNAFPGGPAGSSPKAFNFVGSGWAINANAKNPTAAKEYVNFLSQAAQETDFLNAESAFSTLKDVPSPKSPATSAIAASFAAGDIVPSAAQLLNATNAETEIQTSIQNIFENPSAPISATASLLDQSVKPTPQP